MPTILDIAGCKYGTYQFRYILEDMISEFGDTLASGTLHWSSHAIPGYVQCLQKSGHSFSGSSLTPVEWSTTQGSLTLAVSLPYGLDPRFGALAGFGPKRGGLVVFKIGLAGWSAGEYVPVFYGQIDNLVRKGPGNNWSINIRSVQSLMLSRQATTAAELDLFHKHKSTPSSTLAAAYVVGDTTLIVADATGLEKETGGAYAVRITPSGGDPFVLTATTLLGPVLSGVSATAVLNTTAVNASVGDLVEYLYHIEDHPVNVVRKLAASTGGGTNGIYDTLPSAWGMLIDDALLDHTDMDNTIVARNETGKIRLTGDTAQEGALGWLQGYLGPMGFFITERIGLITVRATTNVFGYQPDIALTGDKELIDVPSYETFNPDQSVEFARTNFATGSLTSLSTEEIATFPARRVFDQDFTSYIDTGAADWHEDINIHSGYWAMRVSESVTIRVAGFRLCQLAPGSHVFYEGTRVTSRFPDQNETPWMVMSCEPNWFDGYVTITMAKVPAYEWL